MRNFGSLERKLIQSSRRGFLSKSRLARTKPIRQPTFCHKVLAGVLLLVLIGALWLIYPNHHKGIDDSSLKITQPLEEDSTQQDSEVVNLENTQEEADGEFGEGASDAREDNVVTEMSSREIAADEEDQRETGSFDNQVDDDDDDELCDRSKYRAESELRSDQITILVNGFSESRLPLLQTNVQAYSALSFVHSIYILWGNTSTPDDVLERWNFIGFGAPIYLVRQRSMSLNDRFLPRKYIETRVVAICDDDITVDVQSLGFAKDVWREDESRIVGFFPRTHVYDPDSKAWLYVRHYQSYSIMLTKFMILATEYLFRYTCEMPAGVKEYVDGGTNCEDIAMNFLASSHSGKGPMLVEGNARDWGDPRNSALKHHFQESALSMKKGHLNDRGDCISAFEKFWHGMKLQYSYSRASSDLENQIKCEKFGYLMDCDKSVSSKRDAARMVGENIVSFAHRYAYVTFLSSDQNITSAILLAQSLRSSGTVHDLVLLLDPSCKTVTKSHVLHEHYDEVVQVNRSGGDPWNSHGKLSAWILLEYAKVVYLEVNSLVFANLDHLFQLAEPAAAPQVFKPGKFSTGLLVLKPSNETYARLVQTLEQIRDRHSSGECLLNFFFHEWFQMPAENWLPARYNFPAVFSKELNLPSWFDVNRAYDHLGPLMVVRYGNAALATEYHGSNSLLKHNFWLAARSKLFDHLQKNGLRPLEGDDVLNWAPIMMNSSYKIEDLHWPPVQQGALMGTPSIVASAMSKARQAFVTVLYESQHPQFSVAGWAESFSYHHAFQSRPKSLLIVLSTLEIEQYQEHVNYFDEVRIVEPFALNEKVFHKSFTLLHLWNQTDFDKLVYVAADSLFVENCNSLLDYRPFAAATSPFPPDTFSTQVMSIQPDQQTYDIFKKRLFSSEFSNQPVERFLNVHYSDWYQRSTRHRISPSYMIGAVFESQLQDSSLPWKILNFDYDWLPDKEANVTRLWKNTLCDLKVGNKSKVMRSLCRNRTVENEDFVTGE
ncbi:unnamed protein product [Calypogeia fissa]